MGWLYFLKNKRIQNWEFHTRIVGSECINWFSRANPRSSISVLTKLVKDGCVVYYRRKLRSGLLIMTVGGSTLPGFLHENAKEHATEFSLLITVTKIRGGTNRVDLKVTPPPGRDGKGFAKVKDAAGNALVVDGRYHAHIKPVIKPTKDKDAPPKVDLVIIKIQDLKDKQAATSNRPQTAKSFIK